MSEEITDEVKAPNPYIAYAEQVTANVLQGERAQLSGVVATSAAERIRKLAYHLCENQKTTADALLVIDLHAAADALARGQP